MEPEAEAGARRPEAIVAVFACAVCGKAVGYEELYPPGVGRLPERGPEHPLRKLDRHWHYVSNGDRMGDSELTADEFERAADALAGDHPASFLALYCHKCRLVYCYDHWGVRYSDDPPRTLGTCPRRHQRVIDW